jgi:hypothetical protein
MKFNRFLFFTSAIFVVVFSSCIKDADPVPPSTNATFLKLSISNNPTVNAAVFTVVNDTIMNVDSLAFGTKIDSLIPTFTFTSSIGSRIYYPASYKVDHPTSSKKDSFNLTGKDTINFSYQPLRIRNFAADTTISKRYFLKINVHKLAPELYVWKKLCQDSVPANVTSQKTIIRNDTLFHYATNGTEVFLLVSTDGKSWENKTTKGLPATNSLSDLTLYKGKMYFTQDGLNIYSSSDGFNWTKKFVSEFEFQSLLFEFKSEIWAVVKLLADNTYRFATSADGDVWTVTSHQVPTDFPVRDFASLSFSTRNGVPKVLVLGGYNWNNEYKKNNWSSEDCINWINFSSPISLGQHQLDTLAPGASIISYDSKIFLFGYSSNNYNHYRKSIDEGMSWQIPDTLYNRLRDVVSSKTETVVYQPRNFQSVVVNSKKQIFIVGGKSGSTIQTDVWTGKLNRLYFIKQ